MAHEANPYTAQVRAEEEGGGPMSAEDVVLSPFFPISCTFSISEDGIPCADMGPPSSAAEDMVMSSFFPSPAHFPFLTTRSRMSEAVRCDRITETRVARWSLSRMTSPAGAPAPLRTLSNLGAHPRRRRQGDTRIRASVVETGLTMLDLCVQTSPASGW